MFVPKQHHPLWLLRIYPYCFVLRHEPRWFFSSLFEGRLFTAWHWHYPWEEAQELSEEVFYESQLLKSLELPKR